MAGKDAQDAEAQAAEHQVQQGLEGLALDQHGNEMLLEHAIDCHE
jgi:hypothetical protein